MNSRKAGERPARGGAQVVPVDKGFQLGPVSDKEGNGCKIKAWKITRREYRSAKVKAVVYLNNKSENQDKWKTQ